MTTDRSAVESNVSGAAAALGGLGNLGNLSPFGRDLHKSALGQVFSSPDLMRVMPGLAFSAFLSNILALALPLTILQILDRVVVNQSIETLAFLLLGVVLALVLEEILRSTNSVVTSWLGARFEHTTTVAALDRLMHVPLQRYQREEPGVHAERLLATAKVAEFYSGHALLVLFDLPFVFIFLGLIYIIGGWLVLVPLALLVAFAAVIKYFGDWMRHQVEQRTILDDRRYGFMTEVLAGILSVKTLTMESLMWRRYERLQEANSDLGQSLTKGSVFAASLGMIFSQVMIVCVVFAAAWIVIDGDMTPGGLAACMMLSVRALAPLRRGMTVWMTYQSFVSAHTRLTEVFKMPYESDDGKPVVPPLSQSLELRNIALKHEGGATLFSGLSFRVEVGQCVAIKGESGSGKSSLMSIMNGLVRPDEGEVLMDGAPLADFSVDSVQKEIALLPQTPTIVSGNILENMTMYDTTLNDEALRIASRLGLDAVVAGMKLGYETQLGQGVAQTMPAGVRQFITIVRALARQPSLILFDEANISLDMRGDQLLRDFFAELKGKATIVLVTHRPSMLSLADKVYSLADGRLTEVAIETRTFAQIAASRPPAPVIVIPERPGKIEDLSIIVRRQFDKESDLSLSLVPLLNALEWKGDPRALAESMPHLIRSLDLSSLCSIMGNLGLFPKNMTGNLRDLDERLVPCMFLPLNRPAIILLKRQANGKLWVFDSAQRVEREMDATTEMGKVYVFQRKDPLLQARPTEASWVGSTLQRFRVHLLLAFALTIASTVLALAPPMFVKSIYDFVLPSGDIVMAAFLMIGVVIAMAVDGFMRNLKGGVMAFVAGRSEYMLGTTLFYRIISLPTSAIEGASSAQQVGRIKNLQSLRDFFLGPLSLLAFELPSTLVLLVAIAAINPWALMVVLLSALSYVLLGYFSRKSSARSVGNSARIGALRWEFLNEALTDMRSIRAVGSGQSWVNRFREISGKAVMAGFRDTQLSARTSAAAQMLGSITGLVALALSAYLSILGEITGGTMMATMMILWRVTGPMQNIFLATTALTRIGSNVKQIEALMKIKGESDAGAVQTLRSSDRGALSFSRVSFRYASDADPSLLGVSFTVDPGQIVAIVGGNGSGKSTLIKLVERLYTAQAGTIRLDDVDIRQLTAADLRGKISYMPQHCELFYGTIAQNLRFVHPAATDDEMNWAIDMVGFRPDIDAMKEGINTRISDSKGDQLPQGFRQRLSLARTILKPACVVLLDEPGTGLDQAGEDALVRCLEWLRGRATVLMVTHRPSHMRLANKVLLMKGGNVLALGPFESIKEKIMSELN